MKRILVILFAVGLSLAATLHSIAQVTRLGAPDIALSVFPSEPMALAVKADAEAANSVKDPTRLGLARDNARRSLAAQGLNPSALRILAFDSLVSGKPELSRRLALLATQASRREAGAQLMLIEDAVARDDVEGALKHYDLALRSSAGSRTLLVPLLAGALEDERINASLAPYIKQRPDWLCAFLDGAIPVTPDPSAIARLVQRSGGWPAGPTYRNLQTALFARMLEKEQFDSLKRSYLALKGADKSLLTSPALTAQSVSADQGVLAWRSLGSASAGFDVVTETGKAPELRFFAGSGDRAIVAQKLMFLTPGAYRFSAQFGRALLSGGSGLRWSATCLGANSAGMFWKTEALTPRDDTSFGATVNVPGNCAAQALYVEMIGGESQSGAEILLKAVSLSRL